MRKLCRPRHSRLDLDQRLNGVRAAGGSRPLFQSKEFRLKVRRPMWDPNSMEM
jgi:hypothetical protein